MFDAMFPSHWSRIRKLYWLNKLKNNVATYEVVVGNPVTFSAIAAPLRQLQIAFSPVQDLHGYDAPWPAGGGVNKFDESTVTFGKWTTSGGAIESDIYGCIGDKIPTTGQISIRIKPYGTSPYSYSVMEYASDDSFIIRNHFSSPNGGTATLNGNTAYIKVQVACPTNETMTPEKLASYQMLLTFGASYPGTYVPYSNECPISGWDGVEVWRTGVNLLNPSASVNSERIASIADALAHFKTTGEYATGYVSGGDTILPNSEYVTTFTPIKSGEEYSIKNADPAINFSSIIFLDDDGNIISRSPTWSTAKYTHTALPNEKYIMCGALIPADIATAMIVFGDTMPTEYVPYNPSSRSISISFGSTVYSGYVDVLTGQGDGDMDSVDMGNLNWVRITTTTNPYFRFELPNRKDGTPIMCETYPVISFGSLSEFGNSADDNTIGYSVLNKYIAVRADAYATASAFKTAVAGRKVAFKCAENIPFTTTPTEVSSLAGDNTMWSNANQPITVEYRKN